MNVNTKNLVVIYEHANYQGENQSLSEGKYNLADINIGNDKLSSIRIPYGIKVTFRYETASICISFTASSDYRTPYFFSRTQHFEGN